jgi:hypothetical protein
MIFGLHHLPLLQQQVHLRTVFVQPPLELGHEPERSVDGFVQLAVVSRSF